MKTNSKTSKSTGPFSISDYTKASVEELRAELSFAYNRMQTISSDKNKPSWLRQRAGAFIMAFKIPPLEAAGFQLDTMRVPMSMRLEQIQLKDITRAISVGLLDTAGTKNLFNILGRD